MLHRLLFSFVALAWSLSVPGAALAQEAPSQPADLPPVAAYVNGQPIFVSEMESRYQEIAQKRRLNTERAARTRAEILKQLVNRRLALTELRKFNLVEQKDELDEVENGIDRLEKQVKEQQRITLEQFIRRRGVTRETLENDIYWQIGWSRYLGENLTDELRKYFLAHKKDLDGTIVHASHILLRPERFNESEAEVLARANEIRAAIESGQVSFAEAAKQHSVAPSGEKGGDIGEFPRRGVMAEEFSKAAFALEEGQVSEPVKTNFGTHLITVTGVKPGTKQWTEVAQDIRPLASVDLFNQLVDKAKPSAKIEYTGLTPYFDPQTEKLVVPAAPEAQPE